MTHTLADRIRIAAGLFCWTLLVAPSATAQETADTGLLTLKRIYGSGEFRAKSYSARWEEDGKSYRRLIPSESVKGGRDVVFVDAATGEQTTVLTAKELTPEGAKRPLRIEGLVSTPDHRRWLIYTNSRRVWRQNTRGDYWVYDSKTHEVRKLGGDGPPSTMMFAKFSPDGKYVAYVRNRNLYVEDVSAGEIRQLTRTASPDIINGTGDWAYEEEFFLRDGFRWSPDGTRIAYWQIDTSGVGRIPLVDSLSSLYPRVRWVAYPKVGTRNPACRIGIVTVDDGQTTWAAIPGDSRDHYLPRLHWYPDSRAILVQQLNRLQNRNTVFRVDVSDGDAKPLFVETDEAWVDIHDELFWLEDGQTFTWMSDRDGWRHVYFVSATDGTTKPITRGDYDVIRLLHIDEERRQVYFIASPGDATQRFLYRTSLDSGETARVTPENLPGSHSYQIAPHGPFAIHTHSNTESPPRTELIRLPEHETIRRLESNQQLRERLDKLQKTPVQFMQLDIGNGVSLDSWLMTPPQLDRSKKYPLLIYVYGEPAGSTVVNRWGGSSYLWHLMLTQQGYCVMSIDNRGTKAPRGRAFRKSIYKQIGILPPKDQAAALQAALRRFPFLDASRVGIWGWSGGGSSSLQAVFKYPQLYKTAIAIASVPDQRGYDTMYQERYMGLPQDNPEAYKEGSPIHFAKNLQGSLLLVHGTGDDNCHYWTTERLINELVAHGKQFQLMAYPGRSHSISEGKNTTMHLRTMMTRFLQEHLLGEEGEG